MLSSVDLCLNLPLEPMCWGLLLLQEEICGGAIFSRVRYKTFPWMQQKPNSKRQLLCLFPPAPTTLSSAEEALNLFFSDMFPGFLPAHRTEYSLVASSHGFSCPYCFSFMYFQHGLNISHSHCFCHTSSMSALLRALTCSCVWDGDC